MSGLGRDAATLLYSSFPAIPPIAAPMARGVETFQSIDDVFWIVDFPTDHIVIPSTVQPDRKLIEETLITPKASSTGLMMTPPPIPQILPIIHAPKATR